MATGTTSDFKVTRNELIDLAMGRIGVTELQPSDYALAVKVLNSVVRHLDAKSTWLWAIDNSESTLTTISGQSEYSTGVGANNIAQNILELIEVAHLEGNERRQLVIYGKQEALKTTLKTDTDAEPIACYLQRAVLRSDNKLQIFPTPNAAYTIKYSYRRPLFDFDLATDNPDFPSEWALSLQKILSYELSYHYGKPLSERQLLKQDFDLAMQEIERFSADPPSYQPLKTEYF